MPARSLHLPRRLLPALLAVSLAAPLAGIATVATTGVAHATAPGGPVVLDGMDSGNHGTETGGVPRGTWHFGQLAMQLLMGQSSAGTPDTVAVIGAADSTATNANCGAMAHWAAAQLGYTVSYFPNQADIDSLFSRIHAGTYTPRLIYITDTHCLNGLVHVQNSSGTVIGDAVLPPHSTDIASFVNRGGALYAEYSSYSWLRTLIPSITVATTPTGSNPLLTPAGSTTFPTLTNSDLVSPWHGYFTGSLGSSLQILAAQNLGNGPQSVIIGGSLVTLPTVSTTSTGSSADIGTTAGVTTTAENPDGSPVSGASVTFTITSGPNRGQTAVVVTGADGKATYSYASTTAGTDVFTTSVVVSSQTYPGSASILWRAAHPTPPGITAVSQAGGTAVVTLSPPVSNGGYSTAPTYTVKAYPGGISSGSTPVVVSGATGPDVTVAGLDPALSYEMVATATNPSGTSDPSPTTWVGSSTTVWSPYTAPTAGSTVPDGVLNLPYSQALSVTGGVGPYTWSLVSGTLPAGLTLNADGTITGTPTAFGPATFTAMVMDGDGAMVMPTVTLSVTTPGPSSPALRSTGVGAATQTATVLVPSGGTVSLLDASGNPAASVTVAGVGTYVIDPAGVISFVPAPGFSGTAPALSLLLTDAYNQTATSTYTATVTKPAAPVAPATGPVTSAAADTPQQTQVTIPPGDRVRLVGTDGAPATSVTVPGQGTYNLDTVTGVITFTPVTGFSGTASGVGFVISDGYGQSASSRYTPTVLLNPAKPVEHHVVTPSARAAASLVLRAHGTTLPVTCKVTTGRVATCTVTLYATVHGRRVVIGTGHRTVTGKGASRGLTVTVRLNHLGRALAAVPGGVKVTASAAIQAPGSHTWMYAKARSHVVAGQVRVQRLVYFGTGSAVLTKDDRAYLDRLRHQLAGVKSVVCNGYTDSRSGTAFNLALGKSRAAHTCAYLLRGLHLAAGAHSFGAYRPQANNATQAGRARNRRAEVILHY